MTTSSTTLMSIDEFNKLVKEMIKEAIHEEMVSELERLRLKELGPPPVPPEALKQSNKDFATKYKEKVGDNVMVPGTNMNLNQFLIATSKETNFKKKRDMITQAADILMSLNMEESVNLQEVKKSLKETVKKAIEVLKKK